MKKRVKINSVVNKKNSKDLVGNIKKIKKYITISTRELGIKKTLKTLYMNKKILIILPTLNEIKNIKILFERIKINLNFNILFVDDNSIDGTREYIQFLKKKEKCKFYF